MSQSDFQNFMNSLHTDEAVRSALKEKLQDGQSIPADDLIALAGEHGYSFTVDEAQEELSDAALEGVSGGASDYYLKIGDIVGESRIASYPKIEISGGTSTFNFTYLKIG